MKKFLGQKHRSNLIFLLFFDFVVELYKVGGRGKMNENSFMVSSHACFVLDRKKTKRYHAFSFSYTPWSTSCSAPRAREECAEQSVVWCVLSSLSRSSTSHARPNCRASGGQEEDGRPPGALDKHVEEAEGTWSPLSIITL